MEICDKFLCVNRKNKECHVPKNVVAFTCKHTNAPCPKARCEYCSIKCEKNCDWRIDRMSISEQVKELREIAKNFSEWEYNRFYDTISRAADTIKSPSAKMADMERSAEDCGGGRIYCGDGENLPKEPFACIVTVIDTDPMTMTDFEAILPYQVGYSGGTWNDSDGRQIPFDVIAWMKAPTEPYHEP